MKTLITLSLLLCACAPNRSALRGELIDIKFRMASPGITQEQMFRLAERKEEIEEQLSDSDVRETNRAVQWVVTQPVQVVQPINNLAPDWSNVNNPNYVSPTEKWLNDNLEKINEQNKQSFQNAWQATIPDFNSTQNDSTSEIWTNLYGK